MTAEKMSEENENETQKAPAKGKAPQPRGRQAGKAIDTPAVHVSMARETEQEIAQLLSQDAKAMKDRLSKQPRVDFLIPLMPGERNGAYETVQLNGYKLTIKKGCMVNIPLQIAQVLADSYRITSEVGQDMLIDRPFVPTKEKPISPAEALSN